MSRHALTTLCGLDARPEYGVGLMVWQRARAGSRAEAERAEFYEWVPEGSKWVLWVFVSDPLAGPACELGRVRAQRDSNCNVYVSLCVRSEAWAQEFRAAFALAEAESVHCLQEVASFAESFGQ
jgi:hypothetical protein